MPFLEVQLDPEFSYGSQGGPEYHTQIISPSQGAEYRNALWPLGRGSWDIGFDVRSWAEMRYLIGFFRMCKGQLYGFRFSDPFDNNTTDLIDPTITVQTLANPGTGTLQLSKTYSLGGITETRNIQKPVGGTVQIFKNGTLLTSGYSIDYTTGLLTVTAGYDPTATYTWSGSYDVPVRFDVPAILASADDFDIASWDSIKILELPPT